MDENNMDENNEVESNEPGRSGRRDFLRRSAVVGGLVWAAPIVQSVGSPAFAFTPIIQECAFFYRAKIELNDDGTLTFEDCDAASTDNPADCFPANWDDPDYACVTDPTKIGAEQVTVDGKLCLKVTLPEDCIVESVTIKTGSQDGQCFTPAQPTGNEFTICSDTQDVSFAAITWCCTTQL